MLIQALLFIATLFTIYNFFWLKRKNLPPGPSFCLPILGHLPFLAGENPARTLQQWSKIYGPILHVYLGSHGAIIIHDNQLIRKAFSMNSFAGRPHIKLFDNISGNRRDFAFADGSKAMELRRVAQKHLKSFGYGTNSMETRIVDQIPFLLDIFRDHLNTPLNVKSAFSHSIFNVLWSIVAGRTFDKNDKEFQRLTAIVSNLVNMSTVADKLAVFIPDWYPGLSSFNQKVRSMEEVQKYLDSLIKEHQKTKVTNQPRDIIDAYLDGIDTSDPDSAYCDARGNIMFTMQDLFIGGVETTTVTLEWIIFYLAKYPNVQEKLQQEIDMILDNNRIPSSEHRQKMPYVEAVIQEISRISVIAPLLLFHRAIEDTTFNDYKIPQDTIVAANIYAVHHDKDIWGDPEIFRPERFIDKDGKFIKSDKVLLFSCGKRSCVGEHLAKLQLFLYTVSIFQRFYLKPVGQLPSEKGSYGFSITVHPFQVQVRNRKS